MKALSAVEISILISLFMVIVDGIIYLTGKSKRYIHTWEFWVSYFCYFTLSLITERWYPEYLAIPSIIWPWRTKAIRDILTDVSGVVLKRKWHMPFILISYPIGLLLYLYGFDFTVYTFPMALSNMIVGHHMIYGTRKGFKRRGRLTPMHRIFLVNVFCIFTHLINFPIMRTLDTVASYGVAMVLLMTIVMAISLTGVTIFELQRDQHLILEKTVKEKAEKLISQSKFAALGEMTAGIVHEVNNPLSVIRHRVFFVQSQIKKDKADKETLLKNLEQIETTAERMTKIVNSLNRFSKGTGNETFHSVPVSIILEDTLSYCSDRFNYANIRMTVDPYPEREIKCKPVQISQVLLNLLNNSFDAIRGSKDPWVKIEFKELSDKLRIRLTDSGGPIPVSIRKKMMEPFFSTKFDKGTGLGLSISQEILQGHNGRLFYDEESPHTTFVIEIPYAQSI